MLVCPSLALMSVPSDQSSPVQTFLSFAGVKQKESLEWPVAAHQNDTSCVFFLGSGPPEEYLWYSSAC